MKHKFSFYLFTLIISFTGCIFPSRIAALPPADDTPEEILRTEMIIEARSPLDGSPLSAAEYAQLQKQIETGLLSPPVSPKLQDLIFVLKVRKLFKTVIPF